MDSFDQTLPIEGAPVYKVKTKEEFLELPDNAKIKKEIKTCVIICYVCAAITGVVAILLNFLALIDVAVVLACAIIIQKKLSKKAAIVLLVYAAVSMVIGIVLSGSPSGYLILIAGIFAVKNISALDKAWEAYNA